MKKLCIIAMAMTLLIGMSQCKKEKVMPVNDSEKVNITLNVNGGNGSRATVNTENGEVTFEENDVIYVASCGVFVGTLTYNGTHFSGDITEPAEGQKLQFYFLGNVDTEETLTEGTSTSCSVVISDQTEHLPVISFAPSKENYQVGKSNYNATLLNKCALVKFNVTTLSDDATCITGFNNKMTIDFSENTLTPGKEGTGIIKLTAGSGEKWAILLPQENLEEGEVGSAYSADNAFQGIRDVVPAINENDYLTAGIQVTVTTPVVALPGAINGKFTINAEGDQVYFSQGNLQYIGSASTPYWKFAENQWEYLGTSTGQFSTNQNVDRDLFGWGTSGWDNGNVFYQPYDTESLKTEGDGYEYGYGPTDGTNDLLVFSLTGIYANADWGVYNAISNGGDVPGLWRTLTCPEWSYVFFSRTTESGILFAKAIVNEVIGLVLLPDDWRSSTYTLNNTDDIFAPFNSNMISIENWQNLEANGAVFLPAAGCRQGTLGVNSLGSSGSYWSSSDAGDDSMPLGMGVIFWDDEGPYTVEPLTVSHGCSVRLVHPAE